jgi:hypothetical protein
MPRAENAAQHASTVADIAKKYRPVPWGTLSEMNGMNLEENFEASNQKVQSVGDFLY